MKKICSLVLFGLLTSASMVYASGDPGDELTVDSAFSVLGGKFKTGATLETVELLESLLVERKRRGELTQAFLTEVDAALKGAATLAEQIDYLNSVDATRDDRLVLQRSDKTFGKQNITHTEPLTAEQEAASATRRTSSSDDTPSDPLTQ